MTKKYLIFIVLLVGLALNIFCFDHVVFTAAGQDFDLNKNVNEQLDQIKLIGLPGKEKSEGRILEVVTDVIRMLLGLMALIFLIIIIIAGFKWMTAGGGEEKINSAKKLIGNALIGLLIIFFAYAITAFVFTVALKPR